MKTISKIDILLTSLGFSIMSGVLMVVGVMGTHRRFADLIVFVFFVKAEAVTPETQEEPFRKTRIIQRSEFF